MDFFAHQERLRRNTLLLLLLYLAAVALIVLGVYLTIRVIVLFEEPTAVDGLWSPTLFAWVAGGTLSLILVGSLYKISALAMGGGAAVAEAMGGRLVRRDAPSPEEQRLLNVVDEMAIASGVPTPAVYLLDQEPAINAFAAGRSLGGAVVAVTRGTLDQLDRDELQGVIGHEFSHILNGDMRLNLRLIGILHGILLIGMAGEGLMRGGGRSRRGGSGQAMLLGLALFIIGYLGVFFGRWIQAAVSRQREFLADASAVQFTRNPAGIAGALKKIGGFRRGTRLGAPRAGEVAHLLFGEGVAPLAGLFSTHPPLEERIRRLEPGFEPDEGWGERPLSSPSSAVITPLASSNILGLVPEALPAMAGVLEEEHLAYARQLTARIPPSIRRHMEQRAGAKQVTYTLLLAKEEEIREEQLALIEARDGRVARDWCETNRCWMAEEGDRLRLPVLNRLVATLKELPAQQRIDFIDTVHRLVKADGELELLEFTLSTILADQLLDGDARARRFSGGERVSRERASVLLFSQLAHGGHTEREAAAGAFDAALKESAIGYLATIEPRERLSLTRFDRALTRLSGLPPAFKRRLVAGCAAAVVDDARVTVIEAELLRAICARLGVPMPPLLPGQLRNG